MQAYFLRVSVQPRPQGHLVFQYGGGNEKTLGTKLVRVRFNPP